MVEAKVRLRPKLPLETTSSNRQHRSESRPYISTKVETECRHTRGQYMMNNLPDEKLVYLTLENVFTGIYALLRKAKDIRKLVRKQQNNMEVQRLIQEHDIKDVCKVAKTLLEQEVFQSTLKAQIHFPELFILEDQSAHLTASRTEVASLEADLSKPVESGQCLDGSGESGQFVPPVDQMASDQPLVDNTLEPTAQLRKRSLSQVSIRAPCLYPVRLPYRAQHRLLSTVQSILEEACYDFAHRKMKEEVEERGWDCPECVELNMWTQILLPHQHLLHKDATGQLEKPLKQLLKTINDIRHTVVHRTRISVTQVDQLLVDAESLAWLLDDEDRLKSLVQIRTKTQRIFSDLQRNKSLLESKLSATFQQILEERARLDQLEASALDETLKEDRDYAVLVEDSLNLAVQSIMATRRTVTLPDCVTKPKVEPLGTRVVFDGLGDHGDELDLYATDT